MCPRIFGYGITSANVLLGPLTLLDNQPTPQNLISYSVASTSFVQLQYGLVRNGVYFSGVLNVTTDGSSNITLIDTGASTAPANFGVSFSAVITSGTLWIQYTTTSTGSNASLTYYQAAWNN